MHPCYMHVRPTPAAIMCWNMLWSSPRDLLFLFFFIILKFVLGYVYMYLLSNIQILILHIPNTSVKSVHWVVTWKTHYIWTQTHWLPDYQYAKQYNSMQCLLIFPCLLLYGTHKKSSRTASVFLGVSGLQIPQHSVTMARGLSKGFPCPFLYSLYYFGAGR